MDDHMAILEPGVLWWIPDTEEPDEDDERELTEKEWDAIYCMYCNGGFTHPADKITEDVFHALEELEYVEKANITQSCPEGEWWLTTKGFEAGELLIA